MTLIKYGPGLNERLRQLYVENAKMNQIEDGELEYNFAKSRGILSIINS